MIQGALDLWQHTMASKLAHRMGRQQILAPFLDALELLGVEMPQDVEALYQAEEEDLVLYISDNMPLRLQECFEDVIPEIQQAGQSLGQLRRRLEADDADGVVKAVEAMDFRCCVPTLRRAVEHAAQEASRLQRCQDSWKATTEARIYRLENAKEEAEKATREFLAVDAKLSTFRSKVSERSQACLMGLSMNSEKATVSSCFAFWRGATEEGKVQQELRDMYEAQGPPQSRAKSELRFSPAAVEPQRLQSRGLT
ncbi:unnamed protein product [Effrenium voratum]|nr:unnamed protein product [Effrenium voratum]